MHARTPQTYTTQLWKGINRRTANGRYRDTTPNRHDDFYRDRGIQLELTREELGELVAVNWPIIQAMRLVGITPSIDRIDSDDGYTASNVQFIREL